jgi:hypothetical protein
LNKVIKKYPYILAFSNEVLNIIVRYETYSFLDGNSGYHHIFIAPEDRNKTSFVTNWGAFIWMVMPLGVKNGPPTFQRIVARTFIKYLDQLVKICLDDFVVYSDMESHLMKFTLCSKKCREYIINFNPKNVLLWYF